MAGRRSGSRNSSAPQLNGKIQRIAPARWSAARSVATPLERCRVYKDSAARREYLREYQRKWMAQRRRDWLIANGPCVRCGSWGNLEIDHIDPTLKELNAAAVWSLSPRNPKRQRELAKCQVLCAECHLKKTWSERERALHGTQSKYTKGCRCDACRSGHAADMRRWRQARKIE